MPPQVVTVKNASKVASALSNDKCKRILDHLYRHKDATETELAKALSIPLSTVHYNMKVLVDAQLVNAGTYSYSSRGKEVTHYKANKNPIVIIQEESQLSMLRAVVPATLLAAGAAAIYQLTQRAPVAQNDAFYAMSAPADETRMMIEAAPESAMMAKAVPSPELISGATASELASAFVLGVVSVLVLSYLVILAMRWWDRRNT
jgi:DNA-binding transcriptional ArsR family regulator